MNECLFDQCTTKYFMWTTLFSPQDITIRWFLLITILILPERLSKFPKGLQSAILIILPYSLCITQWDVLRNTVTGGLQ